jgi:hypothetical protein
MRKLVGTGIAAAILLAGVAVYVSNRTSPPEPESPPPQTAEVAPVPPPAPTRPAAAPPPRPAAAPMAAEVIVVENSAPVETADPVIAGLTVPGGRPTTPPSRAPRGDLHMPYADEAHVSLADALRRPLDRILAPGDDEPVVDLVEELQDHGEESEPRD